MSSRSIEDVLAAGVGVVILLVAAGAWGEEAELTAETPAAGSPTETAAPEAAPTEPRPVGQGTRDGAGEPPFTFVVIGGTTYESGEPMPAHEEAVRWVNKIGPDFSASVGDNIKGTGGVKAQWDAFEKASAALEKPLYLIAGNHDMQKAGQEWVNRFGPLYYAFVHKGCQFIFLCSDEPGKMGRLDEAQVAWLEKTLRETPAKSRFVFCHEGFWREGSPEMKALWRDKIHPLLKEHNTAAVFGGHHAIYELQEIDGIRYYITQGGAMHGTTGGGSRTPPDRGGFQHALRVDVAADGAAKVTLVGADREEPDTIGLVKPKGG
jgi:3',5'-cyclic AMP phosphodiesterase CpdA